MTPLCSDCKACRDNPSYRTRQRQLKRLKAPKWHTACSQHAPATNQWHETEPITFGAAIDSYGFKTAATLLRGRR